MAISKTIRFEVFKRDGFQCAYCGSTPPTVVLEVDHIEPISRGGTDVLHNLITACFDCNRGKRNIPMEKVPGKVIENLEVLRERHEQVEAFNGFLEELRRLEDVRIDNIVTIFELAFDGQTVTDQFRTSIRRFLQKLPFQKVYDAMESACARFHGQVARADVALRYFCGICWKEIKGE